MVWDWDDVGCRCASSCKARAAQYSQDDIINTGSKQTTRCCVVQIDLETKLDVKRELNVFKFNPEFEAAQAEWAAIRREILGEESEGDGSGDEDEEDESEGDDAAAAGAGGAGPSSAKPTQV